MDNVFKLLNSKKSRIIRLLSLAFMLLTIIFFNISHALENELDATIEINSKYELNQVDEITYETEVEKDTNFLDISVIPTKEDSIVEIKGNEDFEDGINKVEIKIKKDDEYKYYFINVKR